LSRNSAFIAGNRTRTDEGPPELGGDSLGTVDDVSFREAKERPAEGDDPVLAGQVVLEGVARAVDGETVDLGGHPHLGPGVVDLGDEASARARDDVVQHAGRQVVADEQPPERRLQRTVGSLVAGQRVVECPAQRTHAAPPPPSQLGEDRLEPGACRPLVGECPVDAAAHDERGGHSAEVDEGALHGGDR
jgi:hypothetical protein